MQKFGTTMEQASDVLQKQVMEKQDQINQSAADKGDAGAMIDMGAEHARFAALPEDQKANPETYKTYARNLQAIRERWRGTMPNQAAALKYDRQTLTTMGRTIFNGAGVVGAAVRKDAEQSAIGAAQAASDRTAANVGTATFGDDLDDVREKWTRAGREMGLHDEALTEYVKAKGTSPMHEAQIAHLSNSGDADGAQAYREAHKGEMTREGLDNTDGRIIQQQQSTASAYVAKSTLDANRDPDNGRLKISEAEAVQQAGDAWDKLHPDDKKGKLAVENQIRIQYNNDQRVRHNDMNTALNTIKGLVIDKKMSSTQQIMLDPAGSKAVDYLRRNNPEISVDGLIANRVEARDRAPNERAVGRMKLMRYENQTQFRQIDPYDKQWGLSEKDADKVAVWQAQDNKADRANDPRPQKMLTQLIPTHGQALGEAGVIKYNGRARDDDTYYGFMGDLINAADAWTDIHDGKPPTDKDIQEIGNRMVQGLKYKNFFGYDRVDTTPFFKRIEEPPEAWKANRLRMIPDATEEDLTRAWHREKYMELFRDVPSSRPQRSTPTAE
jgi:hypothetical protein